MKQEMPLIGGKFGFEKIGTNVEPGSLAKIFAQNHIALSNARSAISFLVKSLQAQRIWLPTYFCPTMLDGIDPRLTTVEFYEIDRSLRIADRMWLEDIQQNDLVVLIDYFGFPGHLEFPFEIKQRGGHVLRDACQALFTETDDTCVDFKLYSPRKFLGVPDGGILTASHDFKFDREGLLPLPEQWLAESVEALIQRRVFDEIGGGSKAWFHLFRMVEHEIPVGFYKMSEISRTVLSSNIDGRKVSQARRENFKTLLDGLRGIALFNDLPEGIIPLGFPVRVENRDAILGKLFEENIYPSVHWNLLGKVPYDLDRFLQSIDLSRETFTIPCDQRYNEADMVRIIDVLNRLL
jgi:dTDP-4-amino-4,6-dideoxygalactose transaminase